MSYCVNCGVELDKTCSTCPLCHTPVHNPKLPVDTKSPKPFPVNKGSEEPIQRYEYTVLASIILVTIALVCFLTNKFVFKNGNWSLYISGLCAVLWIFLLPLFFPNAIHRCVSLILDGLSIAAYLGLIAWLHPGNGWYLDIAVPVTVLATVSIINFYVFTLRRPSSFIVKTALFFGTIAVLSAAVELLICFHYQQPLSLSWSAVVLACCVSIDVILITISFLKGVRAEFRRRMHF